MLVNRGIRYSTILHGAVLLAIILGLPRFMEPKLIPMPTAISIEVVPDDHTSNAPKQALAPKIITHETPVKSPPAIKTTQPASTPPPPPKISKVIDKSPITTPMPPARIKPTQEADPLKDIFEEIKNKRINVGKTAETVPVASGNPTVSDTPLSDAPLSMSEIDKIKQQIEEHWNPPAGAKEAYNLVVKVTIEVSENGIVISVKNTGDTSRYNSDKFYRSAVDAAIWAVQKASPLTNLPVDKYNGWKEIELTFNPKDMMN
jgi:hypothetical protein